MYKYSICLGMILDRFFPWTADKTAPIACSRLVKTSTFESVRVRSGLDIANKDSSSIGLRLDNALYILLKSSIFVLHCNYYLL